MNTAEYVEAEKLIADALVDIVCHCGVTGHARGFPECETARRAARAVISLREMGLI